MTPTLLFTDPRYRGHDPGAGHPESPSRLRAIEQRLADAPIAGVTSLGARPATDAELEAVHDAAHVQQLAALAGRAVQLDPDTALSARSHLAARLAAGAAVDAAAAVWRGTARCAFVLARPPGHHAERTHAMGFCVFNNVAVAAAAARADGAARVLVVDWDVHHGNGTQHIFEDRNDVLLMSAHQFPHYPGTGAADEVGRGAGRGYTVNVALPSGQTDADYGVVFDSVFVPIALAFRPDVILVSAGFDAHARDPLGDMRVTERGFAAMATALTRLADEVCDGRLVMLLEGGYDLDGLAGSVHACLEVLAGARQEAFPGASAGRADAAVAATRSALAPHWRFP